MESEKIYYSDGMKKLIAISAPSTVEQNGSVVTWKYIIKGDVKELGNMKYVDEVDIDLSVYISSCGKIYNFDTTSLVEGKKISFFCPEEFTEGDQIFYSKLIEGIVSDAHAESISISLYGRTIEDLTWNILKIRNFQTGEGMSVAFSEDERLEEWLPQFKVEDEENHFDFDPIIYAGAREDKDFYEIEPGIYINYESDNYVPFGEKGEEQVGFLDLYATFCEREKPCPKIKEDISDFVEFAYDHADSFESIEDLFDCYINQR